MLSSSTKNNNFDQLPLFLRQHIFEYLDLVTWVKIVPAVSKTWKTLRDSIPIWRSIYLNDKKKYSFFYTYMIQGANFHLTVDQLLLNFFKDLANNPSFVDETNSCLNIPYSGKMYVDAFLEKIRAQFLKLPPYNKKTDYLELFQSYLNRFDVDSCYNQLTTEIKDVPILHELINTNDEKLTLFDFQVLIKKLRSLQNLEHLLTVLLIYENGSSLNYDEYIEIFEKSKWFNRLTSQDLVILEAQFDFLRYLKNHWEKIKKKQDKISLEEKDKLLLQYIIACLEKLNEEEILKTYFDKEPHYPTFILTCPALLAKISNKNLLKLALATFDESLIFKCNEFRQRLVHLPNPGIIFSQLVNNQVFFENEIFSNPNEYNYTGKSFAQNILSYPEFIPLLTDEQLIHFFENQFTLDSFKAILDGNPILVERIFSNPSLLVGIGKVNIGCKVLACYQFGEKILVDRLNLTQATDLALKDLKTAEHILKNKTFASQTWEPFFLDQFKKRYYPDKIYVLIDEHLKNYKQFVQSAESGDETALNILLQKAHAHLQAERLSYYVNLAKSFLLGLDKAQDQTVAKQLREEHQQLLYQQAYDHLYTLAITYKNVPAAQLLITTAAHLQQLEQDEKLTSLLLTHPHLIRQFDQTPKKLFPLATSHPQVIIQAYHIQEAEPFPDIHLSPLWLLATKHQTIAQAIVANNVLRNEWLRLKEAVKHLLPLTNPDLTYIQKFQNCLNQVNEDEHIAIFTHESEALGIDQVVYPKIDLPVDNVSGSNVRESSESQEDLPALNLSASNIRHLPVPKKGFFSTLKSNFNQFTKQHWILWGVIKYGMIPLTIGAAVGTVLFFTGGLAAAGAVPILGPLITSGGASAVSLFASVSLPCSAEIGMTLIAGALTTAFSMLFIKIATEIKACCCSSEKQRQVDGARAVAQITDFDEKRNNKKNRNCCSTLAMFSWIGKREKVAEQFDTRENPNNNFRPQLSSGLQPPPPLTLPPGIAPTTAALDVSRETLARRF